MRVIRTTTPFRHPQRWRLGFTLVELMIVITVIVLIMTITVAAFANFIVTSKEKATASTINKINKIIQQRKEAFDRISFKDAAQRLSAINVAAPPLSLNAFTEPRTAEVILRKQRFQAAFPQSVEDRSIFNGIDYKPFFTGLSSRPNFESSALLYLAITEGETFGAPQVDDDAFIAAEVNSIQITTGSTTTDLKFFVDAWGQPLRFYRWPTSLIKPQPAASSSSFLTQVPDRTYASLLMPSLPPFDASLTSSVGPDGVAGWGTAPGNVVGWPGSDDPEPLNRDPDDPTQFFSIYFAGLSATQQTKFRNTFNLFFADTTFHTPLIVSAGPDRSLGLFEPNSTTGAFNRLALPLTLTPTATAIAPMIDNITNLNQRNKGN